MHLTILYQDSDIIVVDKPAGIPTHAADPRDPYPGDVMRIVQRQTGLTYLGMHQRLDADTSGVLLFSARPEANKALAAAFAGRDVQKVYLAAVWGAPPKAEGIVDAAIVRDRDGLYRVTTASDPRAQPARTRYRVLHHLRSDDFSRPQGTTAEAITTRSEITLLEITPETGRTHQVRLHLAHIGCPVVGDPLYGQKTQRGEPLPFYPRLCLHAWRLTLPHPATGQPITFTAPAPVWVAQLFGKMVEDRAVSHNVTAASAKSPRGATDDSSRRTRAFRRFLSSHGQPVSSQGGLRAISSPDHRSAVSVFSADVFVPLLELAIDRRAPLAADLDTTIYRLVNAAADGLPGLTVDRYGDALVAGIYDDKGTTLSQSLPDTFWAALLSISQARAVYVRYRPRQAGRLTEAELAALAPTAPVAGADLGPAWLAHEEGLAYQIRSDEGLSVGLFPDMREGRARVRAWAAGRRVLNCFAYTCGFGLAAMAGGAARVLNLDLSRSALAWGQENYRANGFEPDPYDFVFGDVFDWLARFARRGEHFDLVILDPPGFARAKGRTFSAVQDYTGLVDLAVRVTAPDGLLLACCNVAELPWRAFRERVQAGVAAAGRRAEIIGIHHEPALDFPVAPGQEPYLKMVWLQL